LFLERGEFDGSRPKRVLVKVPGITVVVRQLTEEEFTATFVLRMRDVTADAAPVVDIWPYVESIPEADLQGHELADGFVEYVYRSGDERFDHVLVSSTSKNVYLVIVVDLPGRRIHGHCLLDLNKEYGLSN
jgi:hypothetical protein